MNQQRTKLMYTTGIEAIDDEHRLMLVHMDELECLLKTKTNTTAMLECCNRLFNTIRNHYDHEERLMLKHFFPDTEAHIGQHMNFLSMLGKLVQLIREEQFDTGLSTLTFLMNWKSSHIMDADKKYADFIKTKSA